jgi:hypothetical protein
MSRRQRINNLPHEQKESIAENLKERVYSTISLLAVLSVLWSSSTKHSHISVIYSIIGTVVALWLATLIANRMSYRAIYGTSINGRAYVKTIYTTSGLLAPALLPIFLVGLSGVTGWYDLDTALLVSIGVSLLFLFGLSFSTGWKLYNNIWRLLLVSGLEMLVGASVILLKLAVGE